MKESLLNQLNPEQKKAVLHKDGPMMIIAGAGSGKTRVITFRVSHLIQSGVDPFNILALTFTNKAASEMRSRIEGMVGTEARNLWMGTFHSVFARILRVEAPRIGFPRDFSIFDTDDSKNLIKSIVKEQGLDNKLYKPSMVYSRISLVKNSFISPAEYRNDDDLQSEDISSGRPKLGLLYATYQERLFRSGAMDFDDLLINTYNLLDRFPDVLNKYQHRFQYLMVDEYQDTNYVQYLIVKKLAAAHQNLAVVGDDAQSIYAFRGANINNILNFEKDYPDLKVYKLEQNYRSTKIIVDAASHVIKKNKYQLEKSLWTDNDTGNPSKVIKAQSDTEEGRLISQSIFQMKMQDHYRNNDFAILYRTNAQSRSFEEGLRKQGIYYQLIGGTSFYQRKEIKDMIAYFRLSLNNNDEEALKRVINYPARGIGKTTIEKLIVAANAESKPIWDVMLNIRRYGFSGRVVSAISNFVTMIQAFRIESESKNAFDTASFIAKNSGILKALDEDDTQEGRSRFENVQELLAGIKEFTEDNEQEGKTLGAFLQNVSLLTDADTKDENDDKVTLMTVHAAKGLEFPVVYIVGMEENLFPSQMSMQSREELEEERRLFYVAVTRAEKRLYLSYAGTRYRWGNLIYSEPSRFLEEMDPKYLEYDVSSVKKATEKLANSGFEDVTQKALDNSRLFSKKPKPSPKKVPSVDPNFKAQVIESLEEGMWIEHNRFGKGNVTRVEGEKQNQKVTIEFESVGMKKILLKFAKMRIIQG